MAPSSSDASVFDRLGGTGTVTSIASGVVYSTLQDPRLAALTAGKDINPTVATGKVSSQLCALLGGGCKAPLTDSQLSAAASKVSPDQSRALAQNFGASLDNVVSNPALRKRVTSAIEPKLSGVVAGIL